LTAGGLVNLSGTNGYWFITSEPVSFAYNPPVAGSARQVSPIKSVPVEYAFDQSAQQAFYFVNSAIIGGLEIEKEDIIIAYNDEVIVGSRYWYGEITDVPAMGIGVSDKYAGYCTLGDKVSFKVWDESEKRLIDMVADIQTNWENNSFTIINLTDKNQLVPQRISFSNAYPNPFNPVTMLSFSVPTEMDVEVVVYDMMGRVVSELVKGIYETGNHEVQWDASFIYTFYQLRYYTTHHIIYNHLYIHFCGNTETKHSYRIKRIRVCIAKAYSLRYKLILISEVNNSKTIIFPVCLNICNHINKPFF
jgi:hypothetical protein